MINILIVIEGNDKGGVLSSLYDLSKLLIKCGVNLHFAVSVKGKSFNFLSSLGQTHLLSKKYLRYKPKLFFGIPLFSPFKILINQKNKAILSNEISQLVLKFEINKIITVGFIGIPVLKNIKKDVEVITVLHTVPGIDLTPFKIKTRIILNKLKKANRIVSVSKTIIERLQINNSLKFDLIPNGSIDFSGFNSNKNLLKEKLRIPLNSKCIGSLGRFSKTKGFLELIYVFEKLAIENHDLFCVIGGAPSSKDDLLYYNKVVDLAENSMFSDRIKIIGEVDNKDFYPLIDLFILICIDSVESFGLVLIEAMSAKIPVIVSGFGGPTEIITNEKNGFLVYDNKLSNFIEYSKILLSNNALYKEISLEAYNTYKERFSVSIWEEEWKEKLKL